ncbi:helix-turn-helix domain-containing protein [Clostridium minihomine]|uniref:helix-turn-helix domain-containing protein n=1 Tax=Clostridium minihomine TaxID=2045012 RepID=UPI000C75E87C|nr:helix-turn-helix domain-containing protein [Clostridium minihomine]
MTNYVTGSTIKQLREKKGYTQKQLADLLLVSDKAVSKWETQKGLPDISLLEPLAKVLSVSVAELLSGEYVTNRNRAGNMMRTKFYVCPVCGNVIHSMGEGSFSCCGILLPVLEAETTDETHSICVECIENDYYVTMNHPMRKDHFLSFFAYITPNQVQLKKLYPEQNPEARFFRTGQGILYAYCNQHGLFQINTAESQKNG